MEKVFLRVYNREIESMIEGGKVDEAIAHCQHILQTFPMHVETYRLVGKAFLENRRYTDAADIFQRVLLAVPDDFMSHLGMSIIRDDQGRLNDAIWHMERALEIQPSNSAIQNELRRLYGRRDGVEPSKIRLGRDALANMYSQGELFPQAIAEFRSLLAEDPNRPDLQAMLMRAYYRSGQKVEAKEIAATLLKKYPYCMDALRVFVDILQDSTQADNTPVFRHRLFMLDPYSPASPESVFASDQVADSVVSLERLDYKPGVVSGSSQPGWTSSLGIKLDSERFGPRTSSAIDAETTPFPDWMRPVRWVDDSREKKDGSAKNAGSQPAAPIAKRDLPEWLMSEDTPRTSQEANPEPELHPENPPEAIPEVEDDIPDWLKAIHPPEATQNKQEESPTIEDASSSGEEASYEHKASYKISGPPPEQSREPNESVPASDSDIPDWLRPITPLVDESQSANGENVPDFLKSMTQEEPAEKASNEPQLPEEALSVKGGEAPGFLNPETPAESTREELPAPPVAEEPPSEKIEQGSEIVKGGILVEVADSSKESSIPTLPEDTILNTGAEPGSEATPSPEEKDFPDWMREIGAGEAAAVPPAIPPTEQVPASEQVVSEQPVTEPPAPEQSIVEQPVVGQAVSEQPVLEQAAVDQAAPEQPVVEQAAVEQAVSEQPVLEQAAVDQAAPEQPVVEQAAVEQAVSEQPVMEQAANEQAASEEPDLVESAGHEGVGQIVAEAGTIPPELTAGIPEWLEEPGGELVEDLASGSGRPIDEAASGVGEEPVSEGASETVAEGTGEPSGGEKDTLTWLERLPADQAQTKEDALAGPQESQEPASGVGQEIADTQPVARAMEEPAPVLPEAPEKVEEEKLKPPVEPTSEEKPSMPEEELPEWLKGLGDLSGAVDSLKSDFELPGWLGGPRMKEEEVREIPGSKHQVEVADSSKESSIPTLPKDTVLNTGAEPGSEATPSPEEKAFPDWMREIGAGMGAAVPPAIPPTEQVPASGQVVSEQPVTEPPAPEQSIVEQAAVEQAVSEQPVVEQAANEQAASEEPDLVESAGHEGVGQIVAEAGTIPPELTAGIPEWLEEPGQKPVEPSALRSGQLIEETTPEIGEQLVSEVASENATKTAAEPAGGEEDTLAWLEHLSADQGEAKEETLVRPDESQRATPEAGQEIADIQPVARAMEEPALVLPEAPEKVEEEKLKPPAEPTSEEKPSIPEEELPEWLKGLGYLTEPSEGLKAVENVPGAKEHLTPAEEPGSTSISEESIWEDENIPVTGQAVPTTPEEWVPAESNEIVGTETGTTPESKPIDETLKFEKTAPAPESMPGAKSGPSPEITPSGSPEPVTELAPVSGPEPVIETKTVSEPSLPSAQDLVQPEIIKQTVMLPGAPSQEKDSELLASAQALLAENSLDESMKQYSRLIKKGHLLVDVTKDLREATRRYPGEVNIWQTLGDAYMRSNHLADALDAYTKGEELLR
jgi:Tfp pilus assembly protein PilF